MKTTRYNIGIVFAAILSMTLLSESSAIAVSYPLPDTDQELCYDTVSVIDPPIPGEIFYGQDAQFAGLPPSYLDNGNGTVTDLNTGLMWQQGLPPEKMTWDEAVAGADTCSVAGYSDWRLPDIKEFYSIIIFSGTDPSSGASPDMKPFIDTDYFEFEYGDTLSGERLIDAQYWSSTVYQGLTMAGDSTAFGVNFADGRIKGYPSEPIGPPGQQFEMTAFVRYVRDAEDFGENQYQDNGDGTVTDLSTGLMWQQADDGVDRNWEEALEYSEDLELAGYDDWMLPNARELQSILDYTRSMQATGSPAIDPVFYCTQIVDEGGSPNYGFYWTGTTHASTMIGNEGHFAVYVAFGEALGWMQDPVTMEWVLWDVHGAGAQRSDPKRGDPSQYPHGHGPQGDVVRIYNLVRCVRDTDMGVDPDANESNGIISGISPNPFFGTTTIGYHLDSHGFVNLSVYDMTGRLVRTLVDEYSAPGDYSVSFEVGDSGTGLYLCRLNTEGGCISQSLIALGR